MLDCLQYFLLEIREFIDISGAHERKIKINEGGMGYFHQWYTSFGTKQWKWSLIDMFYVYTIR